MKYLLLRRCSSPVSVAPLVGAWIEITVYRYQLRQHPVAPLVGAWIEIEWKLGTAALRCVAPLVGAWIEMIASRMSSLSFFVAPLVGAWIEMFGGWKSHRDGAKSLPSWERGLKCVKGKIKMKRLSRSPRGSVD